MATLTKKDLLEFIESDKFKQLPMETGVFVFTLDINGRGTFKSASIEIDKLGNNILIC